MRSDAYYTRGKNEETLRVQRSLCFEREGRQPPMRAILSEKLRSHLQRMGSAVLTVILEPLRC